MRLAERRLAPRREVRTPLRFRVLSERSAPVLIGEAQNSSERGVYFLTNSPLAVGSHLELFLPVSNASTGHSANEMRCTARVVHCRPHSGPDQKAGVGVFIERFEPSAG